jgi:large subunit ribosomal protein L9
MARTVQLLLTENVDNLGIVGDVVNVRLGYARNFLLPRELATTPSDEMIAALAEKRKQAEQEMARLRAARKTMIEKLEGHELTLERSCNDQGVLYGGVTQADIAEALKGEGYDVRPRDVRIPGTIKRLDTYDVHIKFESDLEATIKLWVVSDRPIEEIEREEMDFDMEGNLIERKEKPAAEEAAAAAPAEAE